MEYAKAALHSRDPLLRAEAVAQLASLLSSGYRLSDTAFWLAVAHMKNGNFSAARVQLAGLVRADPANERAAALLELYKAEVRREGRRGFLLGLLGVGAAVLLVTLSTYAWRSYRTTRTDAATAGQWVAAQFPGGAGASSAAAASAVPSPWRGSSGSGSSGGSVGAGGARGRY